MANKAVFMRGAAARARATDAVNLAGGNAYELPPKQALAQIAITGTFAATFYAGGAAQIDGLLKAAAETGPEFAAKAAVYARTKGYMKDTPAFLLARLSIDSPELFERAFPKVVDSARVLRTFVQIMRSGAVGRRSLGSLPKRMVRQWFAARRADAVFRADVGNDPSLPDILRMVHPRPETDEKRALYGYLLGKDHDAAALPEIVRAFENFRSNPSGTAPDVSFLRLSSLDLSEDHWRDIARTASWTTTRMNLNTFLRHGVFADAETTRLVAERLRDPDQIRRARAFPYHLLAAYANTDERIPFAVREALQDAMETATANVPRFEGKIYVLPDVSGSMSNPATGTREGSSSKVRCIDVAALVAAAVVRQNPEAEILPFEGEVVAADINPRDSIMTNAQKLAAIGGGSTNCSAPLALLNRRRAAGDLVVYVSDYESWVDGNRYRCTATMREWELFRRRNPDARMVCIDINPEPTHQTYARPDIFQVGGFSDAVFDLLAAVARGEAGGEAWVEAIEATEV